MCLLKTWSARIGDFELRAVGCAHGDTTEKNLGSAQATLQTAEDSVAVQVCQSVPNIAAVQNLNSQLQTLHQSTRDTARTDLQNSRSAAQQSPQQ